MQAPHKELVSDCALVCVLLLCVVIGVVLLIFLLSIKVWLICTHMSFFADRRRSNDQMTKLIIFNLNKFRVFAYKYILVCRCMCVFVSAFRRAHRSQRAALC